MVGEACLHDAVVVVLYYRVCLRIELGAGTAAPVNRNGSFYIEEPVCTGDGNVYPSGSDQLAGSGNGRFVKPRQYLEPAGRIAAHGPQGRRYRQTYHPGARDAHAHAVLEYIAAHGHVQPYWGFQPPALPAHVGTVFADDFRGLGNCKRHRYGFRAPECGFHLAMQDFENLSGSIGHSFRKDTNVFAKSLSLHSDSKHKKH